MEVCEGGDGARAFVSRVCTVAACPPTDLQCCTCHWLPPHPPSPCPAAAVLYFSIGAAFLPGHAAWATLLLWAAAQIGALLAWQLRLPRVIGMLGAGMVMTNVPWGAVSAFPAAWGRQMRAAALATIFLRCGLELDFGTMRRFKYPAVRLALLPGLVRCALCAVRRRCAVSCGLDERVRWGVALLRSALLCPDPPTHQPMRRRPRRFTTAAWASRCTTCRCCWPSPWASSSRRSAPASSCPPCSSCRRSGWAGTRVGGPGGRAGGRGGMGGMGGSARGRMVALEGSEGGGAALVRHRRPPLLPPPPQASPPPLSSPPRLTTSSPSPATPSSPPSPSRGRVTSPGKSPRARCRRERGRLAVSVAWDQGIGGWRPQPSTLDSTSSLPLSPNSRRWCLASSAACWAASSWAAPASSARGPSAWWASTAAPCCSCSSSSTTTCCRVRAALSALRCTGLRCTGLPGAGTGERRCGVPCWRSPLPPPWPHHRCRAHTVACRWCTGRAVRGAGGVQRMGARRAPLRLPWAFARLLARE